MKPPIAALMGCSRRVADAKRDNLVEANKMACRHAPAEPVAALTHVCKHCGVSIDWKPCMDCNGLGVPWGAGSRCVACRGSGIDRWDAVP